MKLLLHDTLTTANLVEPLRQGWIEHPLEIILNPQLQSDDVDTESFALVPSPEATLLVDTHEIVPEIAVVDEPSSAIALRSPSRPDEVESSDVVLYETSATAEILARALLWPFFGVTTRSWTSEPNPDAQIVVVEGALALQEPEAGQSLDLGRSWFVMSGMPLVTHVLVAPRSASAEERSVVRETFQQSLAVAHERRRELRLIFDDLYRVERERLVNYQSAQRYALGPAETAALVALLVRGAGGSRFKPLTRLSFADDEEADEVSSD